MDNSNKPNPQLPPQPPQPQFQQGPSQPQFQQFPPQQNMGTPYQMPPKNNMSKGVVWGIVGASIGLLILIVGIVLAVVFLGGSEDKKDDKGGSQVSKEGYKPTKEDYKDLLSKVKEFDPKGQVSGSASKRNGSSLASNYEHIISVTDDYYKSTSSHKALGDKELKESYDKHHKAWTDKVKPTFEGVVAVFKDEDFKAKCIGVSVGNSGARKFSKSECLEALNKLESSDNKFISQYAKDLKYALENLSQGSSSGKTKKADSEKKLSEWEENYDKFKKLLTEKAED